MEESAIGDSDSVRGELLRLLQHLDSTTEASLLAPAVARQAADLVESGADSVDNLHVAGLFHYERAVRGLDGTAIDDAIAVWERALGLLEPHQRAPMLASNLAGAYKWRADHRGREDDWTRAADLLRELLMHLDVGDDMYWTVVRNLATVLRRALHWPAELDELIVLLASGSHAVGSEQDDNRAALIASLRTRFEHLGNVDDIAEAARVARTALSSCPDNDPAWSAHAIGLASALDDLADLGNDESLRREAESLAARAITRLGTPTPRTATLHLTIAGRFRSRAEHTRDLEDLHRSVRLYRQVLAQPVLTRDARIAAWDGAAQAADTGFLLTADLAWLRRSLRWHRCALRYTDDTTRDRWLVEGNYAASLMRMHDHTAELAHLSEAITLFRAVADDHRLPAHRRASAWMNLANALAVRFVRTGHRADSDAAIVHYRRAIDDLRVATPDHQALPTWLANFGGALQERFRRLDDPNALGQAVGALEDALRAAGPDHPDRFLIATNLAAALSERFEATADPDQSADFDRATRLLGDLDADLDDNDPRRLGVRHNLVSAWRDLFALTGVVDHARTAVLWGERATSIVDPGHGDAPTVWAAYGDALGDLYEAEPDPLVLERALQAWSRATHCAAGPYSPAALASARTAGFVLGQLDRWDEADTAHRFCRTVIDNLVTVALDRDDSGRWLRHAEGLAADAAYAAVKNDDIASAVEHLEALRTVAARTRLQLTPPDTDLLAQRAPTLLHALTDNAARLSNPHNSVDDREALARQRRDLLHRIRDIDGLQRFLLPPDYHELATIVGDEIVCYVAVSSFGGLAIALNCEGPPVAVVADGIVRAEATMMAQQLADATAADTLTLAATVAEVCDWLGHRVLPTIEAALRAATPPPSKCLRLIPVGALALLPLHAGNRSDAETVELPLLEWETTYLLSLTDLRRCREHADRTVESVVVVPHPQLEHAERDITAVRGAFAHAVVLEPDDAVARSIEAEWIHTATHGVYDPHSPLDSALTLDATARIRVRDILAGGVRPRRAAVLAACSSGTPGITLPDEIVSLPGALLEIGFAGVACALWPVPDAASSEHTGAFYRRLAGGTADPATAWAHATDCLRRSRGADWQWAGYVFWGL